jgi:EcsC family protein
VVHRALDGVMNVVLDGAGVTLSEERIIEGYRKLGYTLDRFEDIRTQVPLEAMDKQAAKLARRYRVALVAEGGGAGLASAFPPAAVPALATDVVTVSTVATRAATHYAMNYGFRVESPPERALALSVLNGATSPDLAAKQVALGEVARVAKMVAQKKTWEQLEKRALVRAIRQAAKTLTNRLTKAKLGQLVAVVGIVVGGGYNGWYMTRVAEWGYFTYRDLHLKEKERLAESDGSVIDAEVIDDDEDTDEDQAA